MIGYFDLVGSYDQSLLEPLIQRALAAGDTIHQSGQPDYVVRVGDESACGDLAQTMPVLLVQPTGPMTIVYQRDQATTAFREVTRYEESDDAGLLLNAFDDFRGGLLA